MPEHHGHGPLADSAGQPWEGRQFEPDTRFADDDGSAPESLRLAVTGFRAGTSDAAAVVDAVRDSRLLIPLIAVLGEEGVNDSGVTVDKSAELSIVTVEGPDGRRVLPAFASVAAMQRWNPKARPVPVDAVRVALAAAEEHTDLVVLDPTSESEFVLRRPAVWAIAQSKPWVPCWADADVLAEFRAAVDDERAVVDVVLAAGDPQARLAGPELLVTLVLTPGLEQLELASLLERVQARWAQSETIANRVDSLAVTLVAAGLETIALERDPSTSD